MRSKKQLFTIVFTLSVLGFSCSSSYRANKLAFNDYRITNQRPQDSALKSILKPYSDSVNKSMNDVLAVTTVVLEKKQPEGGLGNLLADAMRLKATEKFAMQVDAAFINNGGVRLPALSVGNITRGKVFEVAPFDNLIILQKLTGVQVQAFLDYVAGRGGWPSSGIRFQIKDKKAINIEIGGKPLDLSAEYTIANNDYVINGGDDCVELKNIPQINKGYVFRDAVIEYLQQITLLGKKISNTIENRVSYAQ